VRVPIFAEWHYWWVQQLADVAANSEQQETQFFSCTKKGKMLCNKLSKISRKFLNFFECI
jgi:hypothetical protein